ncbi:hypothetical protein EDD21DRAFT_421216 [Dissophora ornata]|nr:hypothetical protein EDD21DRAFT_421216 [Dissophora ornata]
MHQVKHLANGRINMIGPFEQVYMENGCMDDEICPGENTHQELAPTSMLSVIALFRIQRISIQTPIVHPALHNTYDAMILNKSTHERGFGYGAIYKSEIVNLGDFEIRGEPVLHHFGLGLDPPRSWRGKLDKDGLLCIDVTLQDGDPICSYIDDTTGKMSVKKYKGMEEGIVDKDRRVCASKVALSRHAILGIPYPARCHHQPPHSPSRITIGIFVESLVGKSGALHGIAQDATPFTFNETFTADDYFGDQLKAAGYNHHGNEPMYSVITGEDFKAHIYLEVVYYPCY